MSHTQIVTVAIVAAVSGEQRRASASAVTLARKALGAVRWAVTCVFQPDQGAAAAADTVAGPVAIRRAYGPDCEPFRRSSMTMRQPCGNFAASASSSSRTSG